MKLQGATTKFPQISAAVLVSTYNRPKALNLVLRGLANQFTAPSQIIIADDGSCADTKQVIDNWNLRGLKVEHCWQEDRGFRKTKVLNEAILRVRSELCIFLDGDCVPFYDFTAHHLMMAERGYISAGPRILASEQFTRRLELEGELQGSRNWMFWIERRLKGDVNRINQIFYIPDGPWRRMQPRNWRLVRGCNFSVPLKDVLAVDGFEESLEGWGADDSDLAVRLINFGLRVKNLRFAAPVLHLWHKEESRQRAMRNHEYLRDAIRLKRVRAIVGISSRDRHQY